MDPGKAAKDLMAKLIHIWGSVPKTSLILYRLSSDGENAWEYYRNDGHDFLRIIRRVIKRAEIGNHYCLRISEYL